MNSQKFLLLPQLVILSINQLVNPTGHCYIVNIRHGVHCEEGEKVVRVETACGTCGEGRTRETNDRFLRWG